VQDNDFIQSMTLSKGRSPVIFVYLSKQLDDMQRFCRTDTPTDLRPVIGIGRTFNPLTPTVAMGTATTKHPVPDRVKPVICNFRHPGTLTLKAERRREMNK